MGTASYISSFDHANQKAAAATAPYALVVG
jgi:hypothetical protein